MPVTRAKANELVIWLPIDGDFEQAQPFQLHEAGFSGLNVPGDGDLTVVYGQDENGRAIALDEETGTPGNATITIDKYLNAAFDAVDEAHHIGSLPYIQLRRSGCNSLDVPSDPDWVMHWSKPTAGDASVSDVDKTFTNAALDHSVPYVSPRFAWVHKSSLTQATTALTTDINSVVFLSEDISWAECGNGYPGPDKIGYMAFDAGSSATAKIQYTTDGGDTWANVSADPFGTDEHISYLAVHRLNATQFVLIASRITTDVSNPGEIARAVITLGDEGTTSWTTVNVGSNNGDVVTAIFWHRLTRLYVADDNGKVFLSEDAGVSFPTEAYSGNQINQLTVDENGIVYGCGASNTLLKGNATGKTLSASLTGPTGSSPSTAIQVTREGIWLGNGDKVFLSRNPSPTLANQWTQKKDFGTNHVVRRMKAHGNRILAGDGHIVDLVVSDTSGNEGDVWRTYDGDYFDEVTNLTNSGYNDAYFSSINDNKAWIVGDDDGTTGIIHKYFATA